jgi:transcription elongation GreA/GreB family factor
VVFTTQFNYFIAISGSEVNIDGIFYYTVSSASPIAKALFGKGERETIIFRDLAITILKVI